MDTEKERKPRKISEGIENTLEGFLKFLLRYFRTLWVVSVAPHRSLAIAYESRSDYSWLVHSLTFLAIGSFLFALLIGVYPQAPLCQDSCRLLPATLGVHSTQHRTKIINL